MDGFDHWNRTDQSFRINSENFAGRKRWELKSCAYRTIGGDGEAEVDPCIFS